MGLQMYSKDFQILCLNLGIVCKSKIYTSFDLGVSFRTVAFHVKPFYFQAACIQASIWLGLRMKCVPRPLFFYPSSSPFHFSSSLIRLCVFSGLLRLLGSQTKLTSHVLRACKTIIDDTTNFDTETTNQFCGCSKTHG